MSTYRFQYPEPRTYTLLPPEDYTFVVTECGEPRPGKTNPKSLVLDVTIAIQPSGQTLRYYPSAGEDKNGNKRDTISEFLLAVNRASAVGEEPDWDSVVSAKGKCRLKIEKDLNNRDRNAVHFLHVPKQVGPTAAQPPSTYSPDEVKKAAKAAQAAAGGDDIEPDDIPF